MQVLKEEVQQRIYKAALDEFATHGYRKAHIAVICKRAKIATGNIYHYYKSKEDLFYGVTNECYNQLVAIIENTPSMDGHKEEFLPELMSYLREELLQFLLKNRKELLIIFEGSQGTRYETAQDEVTDLLRRELEKRFDEYMKYNAPPFKHKDIVLLLSSILIDSYLNIIKHYRNDEWLEQMNEDFTRFYMAGVASLLV